MDGEEGRWEAGRGRGEWRMGRLEAGETEVYMQNKKNIIYIKENIEDMVPGHIRTTKLKREQKQFEYI